MRENKKEWMILDWTETLKSDNKPRDCEVVVIGAATAAV